MSSRTSATAACRVFVCQLDISIWASVCVCECLWSTALLVCHMAESHCIAIGDGWQPTSVSDRVWHKEVGEWHAGKEALSNMNRLTNKWKGETNKQACVLSEWKVMTYLCSWGWSCSTGPERWEQSNIRWHPIPPAHNLDCTQTGLQRPRQSCSPYGGHSGALGLSCTAWRSSEARLWIKRAKYTEDTG